MFLIGYSALSRVAKVFKIEKLFVERWITHTVVSAMKR